MENAETGIPIQNPSAAASLGAAAGSLLVGRSCRVSCTPCVPTFKAVLASNELYRSGDTGCIQPFLCENYYRRLQLEPEDVLGRPLASIVDPLDVSALRNAVFSVMSKEGIGSTGEQDRGTLIHLRVACGGFTCQASMTLVIGTQGLIVVTRLYDA